MHLKFVTGSLRARYSTSAIVIPSSVICLSSIHPIVMSQKLSKIDAYLGRVDALGRIDALLGSWHH